MKEDLSNLEIEVKKYMELTGNNQKETALYFKVSVGKISKCVKSLKDKGIWDEENIKKAKSKKNSKIYREKTKNKEEKSKTQLEAFKYIKDYIAYNYLGYDSRNPNTYEITLSQQLSLLSKNYSDTVILRAIKLADKNIRYYCKAKNFNSQRNKTLYIFAIIKSYLKQALEDEKKAKQIQKRKEMLNHIENIKVIEPQASKRTDLSSFIDDDM